MIKHIQLLLGRYKVFAIYTRFCSAVNSGKLVFHIMAALAEFERDLIRERTKAGMKAAKRRGKHQTCGASSVPVARSGYPHAGNDRARQNARRSCRVAGRVFQHDRLGVAEGVNRETEASGGRRRDRYHRNDNIRDT